MCRTSAWRRAPIRKAGVLPLLFTCSVIIPIALANAQAGLKIFNGDDGHGQEKIQGGFAGHSPIQFDTTTTAAPPGTSSEVLVTRQPFHKLADDLLHDYFSFEDSSSQEKPGQDVHEGKEFNVTTNNEAVQPQEKQCQPCPVCEIPPTTTSSATPKTITRVKSMTEAEQLKDAMETICSIFRKRFQIKALEKLRGNEGLADNCRIIMYYHFWPEWQDEYSQRWTSYRSDMIVSDTTTTGTFRFPQQGGQVREWTFGDPATTPRQTLQSFVQKLDTMFK